MFKCKIKFVKNSTHQGTDFRLYQRLLNPCIKINKTNINKCSCNTSYFFPLLCVIPINTRLAHTQKFAS